MSEKKLTAGDYPDSQEDLSEDDTTTEEEDTNKDSLSTKHSLVDILDDSKYLTEMSVEIDYKKYFVEDLEALFPLDTIEIRECRQKGKDFSDIDKNYPFDPIPDHSLKFSVYSSTERLLFRASHRRQFCSRLCTNYQFDNLFMYPQGQFIFRVHRKCTFTSHLFPSNCYGNAAEVTTGDYGKKYVGHITQVFGFRQKNFKLYDRHNQECLRLEASPFSWSSSTKKLTTTLEFKFTDGKPFAKLGFKGSYTHPEVCKRFPSIKYPTLICAESTATVSFEDLSYRTPVELRALVLASYFLFFYQYWEYGRTCYFPRFLVYIFILGLLFVGLMAFHL